MSRDARLLHEAAALQSWSRMKCGVVRMKRDRPLVHELNSLPYDGAIRESRGYSGNSSFSTFIAAEGEKNGVFALV